LTSTEARDLFYSGKCLYTTSKEGKLAEGNAALSGVTLGQIQGAFLGMKNPSESGITREGVKLVGIFFTGFSEGGDIAEMRHENHCARRYRLDRGAFGHSERGDLTKKMGTGIA